MNDVTEEQNPESEQPSKAETSNGSTESPKRPESPIEILNSLIKNKDEIKVFESDNTPVAKRNDAKEFTLSCSQPYLDDAQRQGKSGAYLCFVLKYKLENEEKAVTYRIIPSSDNNDYRFNISPIQQSGECFKSTSVKLEFDESHETWQPTLQRINNTPDIQFLAKHWFPGDQEEGGVCAIGESIKTYWPEYDDNDWKITAPDNLEVTEVTKWLKFCVAVAARRLIVDAAYSDKIKGFSYKDYIPKRPVNLETHSVKENLEEKKGIHLSWNIIETACASLNVGKHIIFTGPPGCGKTVLAKSLAEIAGINMPIITTASPSWTTDELIGRYMPDISGGNGSSIRFSPGFFLRAIEDSWLIIDELNRADIDACFGELFTVLSGQPAILPFEETRNDEDEGENKPKQIAILPNDFVDEEKSWAERYHIYSVGAKFRLIGTMNDADASRLSQLSYAFQRRFHIIRVEAPKHDVMAEIIKKKVTKQLRSITAGGRHLFGNLDQQANQTGRIAIMLKKTLNPLFADGGTDLVQSRVVGVAQVNDVIDFVLEGLSVKGNKDLDVRGGGNIASARKPIVQSYAALAVTMTVFPQLMAFTGYNDHIKLEKAMNVILEAFANSDFYQIEGVDGQNETTYEAKPTSLTIKKFLQEELKRLFRYVQLSEDVSKLLHDDSVDNA